LKKGFVSDFKNVTPSEMKPILFGMGLELVTAHYASVIRNSQVFPQFLHYSVVAAVGCKQDIFPLTEATIKSKLSKGIINSFASLVNYEAVDTTLTDEQREKERLAFIQTGVGAISQYITWLLKEGESKDSSTNKTVNLVGYRNFFADLAFIVLLHYGESLKIKKEDPVVEQKETEKETETKPETEKEKEKETETEEAGEAKEEQKPEKKKVATKPQTKFEMVWRKEFETLLDIFCGDSCSTVRYKARNVVTKSFMTSVSKTIVSTTNTAVLSDVIHFGAAGGRGRMFASQPVQGGFGSRGQPVRGRGQPLRTRRG